MQWAGALSKSFLPRPSLEWSSVVSVCYIMYHISVAGRPEEDRSWEPRPAVENSSPELVAAFFRGGKWLPLCAHARLPVH